SSLAILTAQVYRMSMHLGIGNLQEALLLLDKHSNERKQVSITDGHEKQLEYLYFEGLAYVLSQQWNKANKCLNQFFTIGKQNTQLSVYRAGRLLHILLCYEQDDMEYLEYEIRSYKRAFGKLGKAFKMEKL